MTRIDIINHFIVKNKYKTYLEIGVQNGISFSKVNCEYKVGVDPAPLCKVDYKMTSNDFFKQNKQTFDVVFVDGLHEHSQVYMDIINSLNCLNKGGTIVCHDMNPISEYMQLIPRPNKRGPWNGDCWKALVSLSFFNPEIEYYTIDTDYGCSVITNPKNITNINKDDILTGYTYDKLNNNRKQILNLISVKEFKDSF